MRLPPLARQVLLGWLVAVAALTAVVARDLPLLLFTDPDDAMRLNEVRDWLGGQSWFDVDQHRLWGGAFRMHWSRLVDLPLAGTIALARPLLGDVVATRVALVLVPLLTLLAVMALVAFLTRRLADGAAARAAILLVPLSVPVVYQMRPLRIDHHGWQIALALAAVAAWLGAARPSWRNGAVAGAALAALLTISLEGLPVSVAIAALAVLAAAWPGRETEPALTRARIDQARGLLAALLGGLVLLHVATRGPLAWQPACDAIAPGWIAAIAVAALGGIAALSLARPVARLGGLALAGVAALLTLRGLAPGCLAGPFAMLDPLVRDLWYRNVSEGMPVWEQDRAWAAMMLAGPVVGLIGGGMAARAAAGEARRRWVLLTLLMAAALGLSILVMRAGSTANALALPGVAVTLTAARARARRVSSLLPRLFATVAAMLLFSPGLVLLTAFSAAEGPPAPPPPAPGKPLAACSRNRDLKALSRISPATLFASLDTTPAILAWTRHRAIASGYHRNTAAIHRVIAGFIAPPARAEALIRASRADYVVVCPGDGEMDIYRKIAPDGLWGRLARGERFGWLAPVPTGSAALVWRVIPLQREAVRH
jgi:hypothetical protein